jgi:hypothetical protein
VVCFLKNPSSNHKGVVVFTTQELNWINNDKKSQLKLKFLKDSWIFGIHHNWHNFKFKKNDLFDFEMAGKGDLIEINKKPINLIPMDCCNFPPKFFNYENKDKYWDILCIIRPVFFKRILFFFELVRKLYDSGKKYRVLCISPFSNNFLPKFNIYEYDYRYILNIFNKKFSSDEKKLFNFVTPNYNKSFPFDLETLSFFYKKSKIFLHTSNIERRPRINSYAHKTGIPVVCSKESSFIVPNHFRKEPFLYICKSDNEYIPKIVKAINYTNSSMYNEKKMLPIMKQFNYKLNIKKLIYFIEKIQKKNYTILEKKKFNLTNLDIRLGYSLVKIRSNNIINVIDFLHKNKLKKIKKYSKTDFKKYSEYFFNSHLKIIFVKINLMTRSFFFCSRNLIFKMFKRI